MPKAKKVTDTQWHHVIAWGKLAGITDQIVKKGNEIVVEGKLATRSYEDKDGNKKFICEIVASELLLVGSSKNSCWVFH